MPSQKLGSHTAMHMVSWSSGDDQTLSETFHANLNCSDTSTYGTLHGKVGDYSSATVCSSTGTTSIQRVNELNENECPRGFRLQSETYTYCTLTKGVSMRAGTSKTTNYVSRMVIMPAFIIAIFLLSIFHATTHPKRKISTVWKKSGEQTQRLKLVTTLVVCLCGCCCNCYSTIILL